MASIQKRVTAPRVIDTTGRERVVTTTRHRARYRDEAGKEHSRHFSRKVDAQNGFDEVTASMVRRRRTSIPRPARSTVRAVRDEVAEPFRCRVAGTGRIVDNALRLHIFPTFGRPSSMAAVRRSHIQALVK